MSGRIILTIFLTFGLSLMNAQIRIIPRDKIDGIVNPVHSKDSASLRFDTRHIIAEPMSEDDPVSTYVYPFVNVGTDKIVIDRLVSSCSCVTAITDRQEVLPGESAKIVLKYNPKGHPGKFERRVYVYTSEANTPAAVLRLAVEVRNGVEISGIWPVQIGQIRLRRSSVEFVRGHKAVEKLRFINLSGKPLRLQCEDLFLPRCLEFRTNPQVVENGQEGEIIISYDPSRPGATDQMTVILKGLNLPPTKAKITVYCRPE